MCNNADLRNNAGDHCKCFKVHNLRVHTRQMSVLLTGEQSCVCSAGWYSRKTTSQELQWQRRRSLSTISFTLLTRRNIVLRWGENRLSIPQHCNRPIHVRERIYTEKREEATKNKPLRMVVIRSKCNQAGKAAGWPTELFKNDVD